MMRVEIAYLGEIEAGTGQVHKGWANGVRFDRRRVETQRVAPTIVDLDIDLPVTINVGWGDRGRTAQDVSVWSTPDQRGLVLEFSRADGLRARYSQGCITDDRPEWAEDFVRAVRLIQDASVRAEAERPEVAAVCADYRKILAELDLQYVDHARKWSVWNREIARRFRRKFVEVGEQTVPGKCCVRSRRGKLLGYADVWNGEWNGRIEHLRAA